MKTKVIRSSIIFALLLMLLIISILAISVIIDNNESEQISLSLIPNNGTRPTSSDFRMLGSRLVTYTGDATTIRANDFPQGVETIGVNAFSTSNVEYVELPQTVKTIEGYAFYSCDTLKNIIIPSGCTSVGMSAFNSCSSLENVMLQFDNPNVFSSTAFAFVTHDFNIYVPKDSYESFYNSSSFSSVKDNLQTWNITLTIEDYTNGEDYTADIAFGETVTLPTPIKEGYAFTGLTDSLNNDYETTFRWMSLDDCNLTANWEIKEFEVVYNGRDGNQYYLTRTGLTATPTKIAYGVLLDNDIIQTLYEDFRNEGEYLESVKINNISVSNGTSIWDLGQDNGRFILDLNFAQKHYNLRFDSTYDEYTFANIDNLQFGDQVILPTLPLEIKTGYLFDGWYVTNTAFSGSRYVNFDIMPDCDPDNNSAYINMWLEPNFEAKTYTVYLNANGGTCPSSKVVTYDRYPSFPTPVREGYKFLGWEYQDERVDNKIWKIDQDGITVKAAWEKLYKITFDAKGGNVSPSYMYLEKGQTIPTLPVATKDGYEFTGWYLNSIDFDAENYYIEEDITLTTKWWTQVTLTDEDTYTVTQDCTYIYLEGILSNLIKPMNIYIASNVENVKFTTNGRIVSCKSIIVNERTTPLTLEFQNYKVYGNNGKAAVEALECPKLNIIARGYSTVLNGGQSRDNGSHGGLVCKEVNFYGKGLTLFGGVAGASEIVDGQIKYLYDAGNGIYAEGDINIYCDSLSVQGGNYALTMERGNDNGKGKSGSAGIRLNGNYDINISASSTLEVTGGCGMSAISGLDGYVSDGGYGIYAEGNSRVKGNGVLIVQGGAGGENQDEEYYNGQSGLGGLPINEDNLQIDSTIDASLSIGVDG